MEAPILVPLDGSALAERALPHAQALASRRGERLLLVCATGGSATETHPGRLAEAYLADVAARIGHDGVVETVCCPGDAARAILHQAHLRRVGLIVMATHGRTGVDRLRYGSVAEAVLCESPVPMFVVRAWQEEPTASLTWQRPSIVVTLDGSRFAEAALPVAVDTATWLQAKLVVVSAVPVRHRQVTNTAQEGTATGGARLDESFVEATRYLQRTRTRLRLSGYRGELATEARRGAPEEVIEAACRRHNAVLAVMTTHGQGGLTRSLLGSVADGVLRRGGTPLLLVRPSGLLGGGAGIMSADAVASHGGAAGDQIVALRRIGGP